MVKRARYSSRQLTDHLREIAAEAESIVTDGPDEGRVITKGETLARLLWKRALGYTEENVKTGKTEEHPPEAWAMQLIWDRSEGRAPQAVPDEKQALSATDRVHELAKLRINHAAELAAAVPQHVEVVDRPGDGTPGPEGPDIESPMAGSAS